MRHYLLISLVILPAVVLIAIVALTTSPFSTRTQITGALERYLYLNYRAPFSATHDLIEQIVPATSPRSFTRQMSNSTVGYLSRQIDNSYRLVTNTELPLNPTSPITGLMAWVSPWPLAYPPAAVWCVRLPSDPNSYPEIVFVARHEDDYHIEWVVHHPAATGQELTADLAKLGCSEVEQPRSRSAN